MFTVLRVIRSDRLRFYVNAVVQIRPIEIAMIKDNVNANWFYLDRFKLDRLTKMLV